MGKWIALALLGLPPACLACGSGNADGHQSAAPPEAVASAPWLQVSGPPVGPLPAGWPAPIPDQQPRWRADSPASVAATPDDRIRAAVRPPNEVCRQELLRQAVYPETIKILDSARSGAPAGTTGLVYLFAGKNRLGWNSQWRTQCQVAADGEVVRFRTVLVPD